jgi:hypothetical protein
MKSIIFALFVGLAADVASAGGDPFSSCNAPGTVPEDVLATLEILTGDLFGEVDESVCQKVVDKGVKLCKSQVKAAAKCWDKDNDTVEKIAVKQCKQLVDSEDRQACKESFELQEEGIDDFVDADREDGLAECEGDFAEELAADCALGLEL